MDQLDHPASLPTRHGWVHRSSVYAIAASIASFGGACAWILREKEDDLRESAIQTSILHTEESDTIGRTGCDPASLPRNTSLIDLPLSIPPREGACEEERLNVELKRDEESKEIFLVVNGKIFRSVDTVPMINARVASAIERVFVEDDRMLRVESRAYGHVSVPMHLIERGVGLLDQSNASTIRIPLGIPFVPRRGSCLSMGNCTVKGVDWMKNWALGKESPATGIDLTVQEGTFERIDRPAQAFAGR